MPLDAKSRIHARFAPALDLPPPFRAVALREAGDAFAHAVRIAADAGAGTLVHVGRFDLIEFAVVLEPDEPLRKARRALYAGLAALADALVVYAPPEKPINFDWPATIRIDGRVVGGARVAWPAEADEDAAPAWLVFGAMVRTTALGGEEPGLYPRATALDEEGFVELGSGRLLESFARYLMVAVDTWQQDSFEELAERYLSRLTEEPGVQTSLGETGDLLLRRAGSKAMTCRALVPALTTVSWLDPATGAPAR
jgi:hypothetical protein